MTLQLHQQEKPKVDLARADKLARTLAGRQVDPNELAKSFTHLRALVERAGDDKDKQRGAVKDWWRWLETVTGPGARAVVRSGRTQDYYRAIEDACLHHLKPLESEPRQLLQALGWAVRLVRFYKDVPGALDRPMLFVDAVGSAQGEAYPKIEPARQPEPPQPKAPEIPAIGATFIGQVIQIDDSAVVVEVPGFAAPQVLGVIKAADLAGRKYQQGNPARVEVIGLRTFKSGRTVVELKPAKRE